MIQFYLLLLIVFWLFGFLGIPFFTTPILQPFPFTLLHILLFLFMVLTLNFFAGKYRKIGIILIVLWVITTLGFISFLSNANLFMLAFILVGIFSIF